MSVILASPTKAGLRARPASELRAAESPAWRNAPLPPPLARAGLRDAPVPADLPVPRRQKTFAAAEAIVRWHQQRKSSHEETMLSLYHGNLSLCRVERAVSALWGETSGSATVSGEVGKITAQIRSWLARPVTQACPYVFLDTIQLKQKVSGLAQEVALSFAVGINPAGAREVLAVRGDAADDPSRWAALLRDLQRRGLPGVELFVGTFEDSQREAVAREFPAARMQACVSQLERRVLAQVPAAQLHHAMTLCDTLRESGDRKQAQVQLAAAIHEFTRRGMTEVARLLETSVPLALAYSEFPAAHWSHLRTLEPIRRVVGPFRERIRVIGPIADIDVLTLLAAAYLRHISRDTWGRRKYL